MRVRSYLRYYTKYIKPHSRAGKKVVGHYRRVRKRINSFQRSYNKVKNIDKVVVNKIKGELRKVFLKPFEDLKVVKIVKTIKTVADNPEQAFTGFVDRKILQFSDKAFSTIGKLSAEAKIEGLIQLIERNFSVQFLDTDSLQQQGFFKHYGRNRKEIERYIRDKIAKRYASELRSSKVLSEDEIAEALERFVLRLIEAILASVTRGFIP